MSSAIPPPPHRSETKKSEADEAAGRGFGDGGGDKLNRIYSLGTEPINTPWMALRESREPQAAHDLGACPEIGLKVSDAPSVFDYFGTPTNTAPVNLPSSLMSGA